MVFVAAAIAYIESQKPDISLPTQNTNTGNTNTQLENNLSSNNELDAKTEDAILSLGVGDTKNTHWRLILLALTNG